jgi:hypothetical protein
MSGFLQIGSLEALTTELVHLFFADYIVAYLLRSIEILP